LSGNKKTSSFRKTFSSPERRKKVYAESKVVPMSDSFGLRLDLGFRINFLSRKREEKIDPE
jgi:hypothetical protein